MARLSSPIENLRDSYAVVVVGSGYGGAIAAARLARAGRRVCLLERGREWQSGSYPRTESEVRREMQADSPAGRLGRESGLYEFNLGPDLNVFKGCGLGGTSLVNAGVALRPDPRVFSDPCWPEALRRDVPTRLQEGYAEAERMLRSAPYPADRPPPAKLVALGRSARFMGAAAARPPINVNFAVDGANHVGVEQHPCVECGDCVTGCNYAAKNTLMMNYLPYARAHGAEIFTEVAVRWIERPASGRQCSEFGKEESLEGPSAETGSPGIQPPSLTTGEKKELATSLRNPAYPTPNSGTQPSSPASAAPGPPPPAPSSSGWLVHCRLLGLGRERFHAPEFTIRAGVVILGAGALGTTEILLRSRRHGLALSAQLGERLTGNGDLWGFAYNSAAEVNGVGWGGHTAGEIPPVGPCITGMIDLRGTPQLDDGLVIEEGSPPGALAALLPEALGAADAVASDK